MHKRSITLVLSVVQNFSCIIYNYYIIIYKLINTSSCRIYCHKFQLKKFINLSKFFGKLILTFLVDICSSVINLFIHKKLFLPIHWLQENVSIHIKWLCKALMHLVILYTSRLLTSLRITFYSSYVIWT